MSYLRLSYTRYFYLCKMKFLMLFPLQMHGITVPQAQSIFTTWSVFIPIQLKIRVWDGWILGFMVCLPEDGYHPSSPSTDTYYWCDVDDIKYAHNWHIQIQHTAAIVPVATKCYKWSSSIWEFQFQFPSWMAACTNTLNRYPSGGLNSSECFPVLTAGWQFLSVDDLCGKLETWRLLHASPHHRECTPAPEHTDKL